MPLVRLASAGTAALRTFVGAKNARQGGVKAVETGEVTIKKRLSNYVPQFRQEPVLIAGFLRAGNFVGGLRLDG
jgi:hypothetical protein